MKSLKKVICTFLFSILLLAGAVPAMAAEGDAAEVIDSSATASGKEVTVTVTTKEALDVTSGRIIVFYDPSVLTLETETPGETCDTSDFNNAYADEEKTGVAFAWASAEEAEDGATIFTLNFLAADDADGKTTAVETQVVELYAGDTALTDGSGAPITSDVAIVFPEDPEPGTGSEPGTNPGTNPGTGSGSDGAQVNPSGLGSTTDNSTTANTSTTTANGAQTGDNNNVVVYVLVLCLAVVVLAYAAKRRRNA